MHTFSAPSCLRTILPPHHPAPTPGCPAETLPMPHSDSNTPPATPAKQPHWLAVVALLVAGLTVAGLVSYVGSTALTS
ncbi:MAG: hypothetical protein U5L06_05415 [Rhodovibrio sp.]|nr:hypothetical protein [Rhodovibrio sp.]